MEAVESVCSYLPSQYKDECNNLVETYGEEIIDAINKDISPENLCAYIGACPKQVRRFFMPFESYHVILNQVAFTFKSIMFVEQVYLDDN